MWEIPVPGWLCVPRCRHAPALGSGCTRTRRGLTPVLPFPYPNSRIHRGLQPQPKRVPSFQGLLPCMGLPDSAQGGSNHPQPKPHPMPWVQTEPVSTSETAVPVRRCPQHFSPLCTPAWSRMNCPQNTSPLWPWGKGPPGKATPDGAGIGPAPCQHRSSPTAAPVAAPMGHDPKTHRWWAMPGWGSSLCDPHGACF